MRKVNNTVVAGATCSSLNGSLLDRLPDCVLTRVLSFLSANDVCRCARVSRRFYVLSWDPALWTSVVVTGERTDADLAIKTILRYDVFKMPSTE